MWRNCSRGLGLLTPVIYGVACIQVPGSLPLGFPTNPSTIRTRIRILCRCPLACKTLLIGTVIWTIKLSFLISASECTNSLCLISFAFYLMFFFFHFILFIPVPCLVNCTFFRANAGRLRSRRNCANKLRSK